MNCSHDGWGTLGYSGEVGPCPPPAEMRQIDGGWECPVCESRVQMFTGAAAQERMGVGRETATLEREVR